MKTGIICMIASFCLSALSLPTFAESLATETFSAPVGILELPDGAFLVAEWSGDRVSRMDASGKRQFIKGISSPAGLAMDKDGAIYIAGYGDGNIYVWRRGEGEPEILARGFRQPTGLLWSRDDTLLVANRGAGTVEEIGRDGARRIVSQGHSLPVGIAQTDNGDMYVSCYGGTLDRVSGDGKMQKIRNGLNNPGVGIIPAGPDTVFVVDNGAGAVVEAGANGVIRTLKKDLSAPVGLARTSNNEILVATWGDGKIQSAEVN